MYRLIFALIVLILFSGSCVPTRNYRVEKKYPKKALTRDYLLLKEILEKKHPSLYWYTPKDSMDVYFDRYFSRITDSMTEPDFYWNVLAPLINKIHCGHTSLKPGKAYAKWLAKNKQAMFPLYLKIWNDSMVVTANLNKKDSVIRRGSLIHSINGLNARQITDSIFDRLPEDGYAANINYIRLSNNFPALHRNVFGVSKTYQVAFTDSSGIDRFSEISRYEPDTSANKIIEKPNKGKKPKPSRSNRLKKWRDCKIDSSGLFATMTLTTFMKGNLSSFFKKTFRELRQKQIPNLILDLRQNGGGRVSASTLLTRYLSREPFKVADSIHAKAGSLKGYRNYIKGALLHEIAMMLISRKMEDGRYHMNRLELKTFMPKKKNHFDGRLYVLISGPTFSAASLVCNTLKGQKDIWLAGEETGGGWHGNNGILIPDIRLPETGIGVRLPLYRVIQYKHVPKTGIGVLPDIPIPPNYEALIKGKDKKMETVKEMILKGSLKK